MFDLNKVIRKNILNLKPYSSARDEFSGNAGIFLDANENPFGKLNRYPDPFQKELKRKLSEISNIGEKNIFLGNGSDEVIDLAYRIFCEPDKDKALTFTPTYGMYEVSAAINDVELIKVPLTQDFDIDINEAKKFTDDISLKLIFICSPNNPTGNSMGNDKIKYLLENFNGIVIIDEAYIEFSDNPSWSAKVNNYPNLIVTQTFSKARGLAAARLGIAYADENIIKLFNKVKPPYNVSSLNQKAALEALENYEGYLKNKKIILNEKRKLAESLKSIPAVKKVYPSDANFFLVEVEDADKTYNKLISKGIIVRNRDSVIKNCIRITVGTPEENKKLIKELKKIEI